MEEQLFKLQTEDGGEQLCRVVFTFDSEDHSYVLFTLVGEDGEGNADVSALRYELDENGEMADFADLESDEEWAMVEEVMNTLIEEFGEDQTKFITITDENGDDIVCEILHRFELKEFGKSYLFYGFADEDGVHQEIFAAGYTADENGAVEELLPIETDAEWAKVEEILQTLQQSN
ncbi:DUF1292 domain-containing protein [Solibacillus sp. FSL H8-0538]|uniref:DUF1292 domain-containing protein n=1 Tax=Solibacillus sp. FSL H8-0538 TaxID=2921400 RepID=UPI0030F5757C